MSISATVRKMINAAAPIRTIWSIMWLASRNSRLWQILSICRAKSAWKKAYNWSSRSFTGTRNRSRLMRTKILLALCWKNFIIFSVCLYFMSKDRKNDDLCFWLIWNTYAATLADAAGFYGQISAVAEHAYGFYRHRLEFSQSFGANGRANLKRVRRNLLFNGQWILARRQICLSKRLYSR